MQLSESVKLLFPEGIEEALRDTPIYNNLDEVIGFESFNLKEKEGQKELFTLFGPVIPLKVIAGVECLRFNFDDFAGFARSFSIVPLKNENGYRIFIRV